MTTCKSILAILILPTDFKVIAVISAVLGTIVNLIFFPFTITVVVIILHSKVFSTFKY
jgi:hypothetical protein